MNEYRYITVPEFDSPTDADLLLVADAATRQRLESTVEAARERAFHGYLANALQNPEAYENVTVTGLIARAKDWAECEWPGYLTTAH